MTGMSETSNVVHWQVENTNVCVCVESKLAFHLLHYQLNANYISVHAVAGKICS